MRSWARTISVLALVLQVCRVLNAQGRADINAKYAELGGATGPLGPALSEDSAAADSAGLFRVFRNGFIFWTTRTGAHAVFTQIADRWITEGGPASLGLPHHR